MISAKSPKAPSTDKTLRRLFLTIFLRGHAARGMTKQGAPGTVAQKLAGTLFLYAFVGVFVAFMIGKPVFALSLYLHALTFLVVGMFVTASAGELLFNKDESEILMHRPISSRSLLVAKITVLVQVSLYLAAAVNLTGFFVGVTAKDGGWSFLLVHALSVTESAVFCAACVVLVYELCMKWFGRERLESLMTAAQVLLMIGIVLGSQLMSRQIVYLQQFTGLNQWWTSLLPPAWFAGLDDALAGSHTAGAWKLAGAGLLITGITAWLAFGRLAGSYESGVQTLNEATASKPNQRAQLRLLQKMANARPLRWWMKGSVEKASFVLVGAYLFRDRDTKLRVYPGLAPFLVMPFMFMFSGRGLHDLAILPKIAAGVSGAYMGIVPLMALTILKYSQQWKAAEVFQIAPTSGPWAILRGAQVAVITLLTVPMLLLIAIYFGIANGLQMLIYLIPGAMLIPVYALVPAVFERTIPLSNPAEEAKSTGRGVLIMLATLSSLAVGGAAPLMGYFGLLPEFLIGEALFAALLCFLMNRYVKNMIWQPEV